MKNYIINALSKIFWYSLLIIGYIPAQIFLKIWGWNIVGEIPKLKKMMVIVTPHRKGLKDVLLGLFVSIIKFIPPVQFLAKYEAMHPWWNPGKLLYLIGGIPTDRKHEHTDSKKGDIINTMIRVFKEKDNAIFVLVPEGTRAEGAPWRRGFYITASNANIPVVPVGFDYKNKTVVIGLPILMTGNSEKDLHFLKEWYIQNVPGYAPVIDTAMFNSN